MTALKLGQKLRPQHVTTPKGDNKSLSYTITSNMFAYILTERPNVYTHNICIYINMWNDFKSNSKYMYAKVLSDMDILA